MKAHTYRNCFLAVVVSFSLHSICHGDLISIDFDEVGRSFTYSGSATTDGGLVPFAGQVGTWNQLEIGTAPLTDLGSGRTNSTVNTNSPSLANLVNGSGAVTPVTFTLNPGPTPGTYNSYTFGPPGPGGGVGIAPTDDLGRDVVYLSSTSSLFWEFTNLLPNNLYNIRIFGQTDGGTSPNNNNPHNFGDFSVNGGGVETPDGTPNYVDFGSVMSDATGRIFGTLSYNGTT